MKEEIIKERAVWPVSKLVPYELNAKKHDKAQVAVIAKSIKEFGFTQPILVEPSGSIIAGHGRRLACIELGMETVDVIVIHGLTPDQVRGLRLIDNRANDGGLDLELLKLDVGTMDFDLTGFFTDKELEFTIGDMGDIAGDAFIDDVDGAVKAQEASTKDKIAALADKPIAITKLFGFKEVKGSQQLLITRMFAKFESMTGLTGADALHKFAETFLKTA